MSSTNLKHSPQKTNSDLLLLMVSAGFDKSRIVIAGHELSSNFLTLYLEDMQDIKTDIADTLMYKIPVSRLAAIIEQESFNSYDGILHNESGRCYDGKVVINEPLVWWEQDATAYQQKEILHILLQYILNTFSGKELGHVA